MLVIPEGRALTLVFVSTGSREGAIETLRVGDYKPITKDDDGQQQQIVAGRLVV
jgi:hypothetical protein